jgi:hypothetical protein
MRFVIPAGRVVVILYQLVPEQFEIIGQVPSFFALFFALKTNCNHVFNIKGEYQPVTLTPVFISYFFFRGTPVYQMQFSLRKFRSGHNKRLLGVGWGGAGCPKRSEKEWGGIIARWNFK